MLLKKKKKKPSVRWREIGLIAGLTHSTAEPSTLGDCWEGGLPCEHGASAPDDGREVGTGTGSVSSKSVHYINCASHPRTFVD